MFGIHNNITKIYLLDKMKMAEIVKMAFFAIAWIFPSLSISLSVFFKWNYFTVTISIYWMHNMHILICIYWMKPKFKMAYLINFPLGALFQPILHRFPKPQKLGANSNIAIKNIQIRSKYEFKMSTTIKMDIHSRDWIWFQVHWFVGLISRN
jgi:hypothetical protein